MDKLNVCLINDSFPPAIDGVANAVVNYGRIINGGLGRASVVTPYYPEADDSVFSFPVIRYPSIDMTRLVGYRAGLPFSADVMRQLEGSGFDLIHSHCPITSTLFARTLRERLDVPIVLTYHTKFDIDIANAIKSKRLQTEAIRLLARREGILVDPVYSGKAFAGLIADVRSGQIPQGSDVLFVHTGGSTVFFAEKEILGELV